MGSHPKRRTCRRCGKEMGFGEYAEVRVLRHFPQAVKTPNGMAYTRWLSKSMMTEYICTDCAEGVVDGIKEARTCQSTE